MLGSSIIGQKQAVELLERAIKTSAIAPAYLLVGPLGTGRTLLAKSFSYALLSQGKSNSAQVQELCQQGNHPDLLTIQPTYLHQGQLLSSKEAEASGLKRKAPPQIRIEQIRELTRFLSRPPLQSPRAVVIIEDAQTMTEGAANALLKTLEEPGQATLILISPSADSLLPTLVSRCQKIPFFRLNPGEMREVLALTGYESLLSQPELMSLAQGSPGAAIAASHLLQTIPPQLRQALTHLPATPLELLALAKQVSQELDPESQLCLLDYLQHNYWQNHPNPTLIASLEQSKVSLLAYVQSRLVWECTLLRLAQVLPNLA